MAKTTDRTEAPAHSDIEAMSFEQAVKELEAIVRKLESGQGDLETSIADYTRGTALREHCQRKLENARLRVEKIIQTPQGIAVENFDAN